MAATVETQRLISLSLGKIAQSRGQRGGINLHKNLLVATVLHKARTAYMMETYSYHQQQQTLQRQKLQQEQLLQQHQEQYRQQQAESITVAENEPVAPVVAEMGQAAIATPLENEESRSTSPSVQSPAPELVVTPSAQQESEGNGLDKENHPPASVEPSIHEGCVDDVKQSESRNNDNVTDHLTAATQLAQDAALSSDCSSNKLTSGSPTCNGILKRRRDNPQASLNESECPASKKARVINDVTSSFSSLRAHSPCQFTPINSDYSSDESDCESDSEVSMMHTESPQINNLVTIFNSGFSGLCASNNVSEQDNSFTSLAKLRAESPTPSSFARKCPEPSLMCSSEVGRLGSLPSAIVLSA